MRLLLEESRKNSFDIWSYCLMDNHVHLIVVPKTEKSLSKGIGETHRRYTSIINLREGWRGYLWQGRFLSYPLDDGHLYSAIRYVERNSVRAGMVEKAEDYKWSSARYHVNKEYNDILSMNILEEEISNWQEYLRDVVEEEEDLFKRHAGTGRPLGDKSFVEKLEELTGRKLKKRKPGPKIKQDKNN